MKGELIMGYYTYHSLHVRHTDHSDFTTEQLEQITSALNAKDILGYALERHGEVVQWADGPQEICFAGEDCVKWYEHRTDMVEISEQFPDCVFNLSGEGEDQGDVWNEYYLNGDVEECMMECHMPEPMEIPW